MEEDIDMDDGEQPFTGAPQSAMPLTVDGGASECVLGCVQTQYVSFLSLQLRTPSAHSARTASCRKETIDTKFLRVQHRHVDATEHQLRHKQRWRSSCSL
ncbi:hypothetical protein PR002_g25297 [Phytophthora rubi]|uniref:Uncharacterized protein n=1 Tax=Phytophthora rubi TaxID=129364 RepID=A0A6A3I4Z6_9STRA|nr:hypothetical protein PR002_g25297 [Phytophthora rubi]